MLIFLYVLKTGTEVCKYIPESKTSYLSQKCTVTISNLPINLQHASELRTLNAVLDG